MVLLKALLATIGVFVFAFLMACVVASWEKWGWVVVLAIVLIMTFAIFYSWFS